MCLPGREFEILSVTVMGLKRRVKEVNWDWRLQNSSIHSSMGMNRREQNNQSSNTVYFGNQSTANFSEQRESRKDTTGLKTPPANSRAWWYHCMQVRLAARPRERRATNHSPQDSGDWGMLYSDDPPRTNAGVTVKGLSALTNAAAKASHMSELCP